MSSREVAVLVESRHADVCRTIERLMAKGVIGEYAPMAYTHEQNGQRYSEYRVCKRDSYVVVAQLSPEFTARLVDRWQELESRLSPTLPQSLPEALRLAADMAEKNAQLSVANEQLAGEVEALHNLFDEGMTPTAFAKRLNGVNCQQLSHELHRRNWLYHDGFGWRVTSYARDRYLTERHSNVPRSSGQVMLRATPVLLRKGAVALHKFYLDGQLPMKRTWDGLFTHNKAIEKVA